MKILGLRSLIYPSANLDRDKSWWQQLLGIAPYFDEPFYVGFNVGGYEIGLSPGADASHGATTYLGVSDIQEATAHAISCSATLDSPIEDVGGDLLMSVLISPNGERFGFIYNPHFKAEN